MVLQPVAPKRALGYPRGTNSRGCFMPTVTLTDRFCATAKPIGSRTDYFDSMARGLALRVTDKGHRSWCFHFRSPRDGKRARATIGRYPSTTLATARGKALEARGHVDEGNDPRLVLAGQATTGMTVAGLVDAYLADPEKAALRSRDEIARRLRKNVVPVIGEVKLSELRRRDARKVTDAMLRRGVKAEAIRVFEDVRGIVRWAVQHEYIETNPLAGMAKPAEATSRDRVLADDEIQSLWANLPEAVPSQVAQILKLCLVTGQRVGEVAGMARSELDLVAREWRLPGARTKNGHAHTIPLCDMAIAIIDGAMGDDDRKYVFQEGRGSLSPAKVARIVFEANSVGRFGIDQWSSHDLRRTTLTGMARMGVAPIVLGHVANHRSTTRAGVTLAVYARYTYDKEKRAALELWADRLAAITGKGAANVVSIERGQR
ncbi:MAG: tyrosine-type recombinase/integrase [Rhizobiales bacterium]|nr:tyrosine-type recombinase/integrase [Hyphomicrobiales bacterium]